MGRKKKIRFPAYTSVVGEGTVINGALSFSGGLHVDGRIVGNLIGEEGELGKYSALTLAACGVIEGNLDVPCVIVDGTVTGDIRASRHVVLASRARVTGTVYYGALEMDEGAEIDGKLVPLASGEDLGKLEHPMALPNVSATETAPASADAFGVEADPTQDSGGGA